MCTLEFSGCGVKPRRPHQTGPPGLAHEARELQTCTFEGPGAPPPKFHEKDQKRLKKDKNCGGRGKKKREILGPHRSGPHPSGLHPSGPHFFWVWAPTLSGPTMTPKMLENGLPAAKIGRKIGFGQNWRPKLALAKIGRAKTTMAKNGLAKIGLAKIGNQDGQNGIAKVGFFL